jgi:hypothetical protein
MAAGALFWSKSCVRLEMSTQRPPICFEERIMKARSFACSLAFSAALCAGSCATFDEVYHFALPIDGRGDGDETHHHHYRVRIKGWTFLSASQYAAGLYDASAVDALFGEVEGQRIAVDRVALAGHQPRATASSNQPAAAAAGESATSSQPAATRTEKANEARSQKLVIFLSTNADFYLRQLKDFIQTSNLQTNVSALLLAGDAERALQAEHAQEGRARATLTLASKLEQAAGDGFAAGKTPEAASAARSLAELLRSTAALSNDGDGAGSIVDAASARAWLGSHPRAFRASGGGR